MGSPTPVKISMNTAASPSIRRMPVKAGKQGDTSPSPYKMSESTAAKPSVSGRKGL